MASPKHHVLPLVLLVVLALQSGSWGGNSGVAKISMKTPTEILVGDFAMLPHLVPLEEAEL